MRSTFTVLASAVEASIKGYATRKLRCGWAAVKRVGMPSRILPHAKMLLFPIRFFLCLKGSTFSLSKCDFSCLFHTDGAHIDLLWFCLWSAAFQITLLQRHKKFRCLIIFSWQHAIKNSDGQMRQIYRVGWKWSTRRLVEGGMSTGLTNKHTARGFSDLYHVFARKQCILCPSLRHGCLTLLYVTSIRDFFCPWNNRARLY